MIYIIKYNSIITCIMHHQHFISYIQRSYHMTIMTHDPQIDYDSFQHPMASHGMAAGKQLSDSKGASAAISPEAAVLSVRRVGRLNRSQAGDRFEISGGC